LRLLLLFGDADLDHLVGLEAVDNGLDQQAGAAAQQPDHCQQHVELLGLRRVAAASVLLTTMKPCSNPELGGFCG
jgi:hypothetical protein